jgi:hypothetical protein
MRITFKTELATPEFAREQAETCRDNQPERYWLLPIHNVKLLLNTHGARRHVKR